MTSDSEPGKGLIIKVARRPRTRRGELPHPTLRLMCEDPNGILYVHETHFLSLFRLECFGHLTIHHDEPSYAPSAVMQKSSLVNCELRVI